MELSKRTESHFRDTPRGMVLVATQTPRDGLQFPPSEFMHGGHRPQEAEIGPTGRLYSYTVVHAGKDRLPYGLAMVDFEPGVRVFGRLLFDTAPPAIDSVLRIIAHTLPDGAADYAFSPV